MASPSATTYRGFNIDAAYIGWQWVHPEYDGPEDRRCGHARTIAECHQDIDDFLEENPE